MKRKGSHWNLSGAPDLDVGRRNEQQQSPGYAHVDQSLLAASDREQLGPPVCYVHPRISSSTGSRPLDRSDKSAACLLSVLQYLSLSAFSSVICIAEDQSLVPRPSSVSLCFQSWSSTDRQIPLAQINQHSKEPEHRYRKLVLDSLQLTGGVPCHDVPSPLE